MKEKKDTAVFFKEEDTFKNYHFSGGTNHSRRYRTGRIQKHTKRRRGTPRVSKEGDHVISKSALLPREV